VRPPMLNAKSSENFLSPDQNWANFGGFGGFGGQGFQKVAIFTPKGTSLREPTSFEPFCVKIGRGVWPPGRFGKKNPESHRASHRKDMSPLTQGLNYRSACDCTTVTQCAIENCRSVSKTVKSHSTPQFNIKAIAADYHAVYTVLNWRTVLLTKTGESLPAIRTFVVDKLYRNHSESGTNRPLVIMIIRSSHDYTKRTRIWRHIGRRFNILVDKN